MTLEGRIVGVRMSKSSKVEYVFQPERIAEVLPKEKFPPLFMIKRDEDKRYPLLRFDSPFMTKGKVNVSEAFSLGYLLVERKDLVRIGCQKMEESSKGRFNVEVDLINIGYGFQVEA